MVSVQLQASYGLDMFFSVVIVAVQLSNIHFALSNFGQKALQRLQSLAYIVSFASGIASACLAFGMSIPRLIGTGNAVTLAIPIRANDLVNTVQMYLQVIVIIQRLHIINFIRLGHSTPGIRGKIAHRWLEIVWTVIAIAMCYVCTVYHAQLLEYYAATVWLVSVFLMDLVVSLITFERMLRMLNTNQKTWQWYWATLWLQDEPTSLSDKVQVNKTQTLSIKTQSAGRRKNMNTAKSKRMVVRSWTLVMLSLIMGTSFFLLAWCGYPDSDVFYAPYRVAWMFVCIWQRGGLLYFAAIKQVQTAHFPSESSLDSDRVSQIAASRPQQQ
ncbi:hypothetical protein RI367_005703 [Sorochytrium milnesiophthora]